MKNYLTQWVHRGAVIFLVSHYLPPLLLHYANAHQLYSVGASFRRFACQRKFYLKPTFVLLGFTVLWELKLFALYFDTLPLDCCYDYLFGFIHAFHDLAGGGVYAFRLDLVYCFATIVIMQGRHSYLPPPGLVGFLVVLRWRR